MKHERWATSYINEDNTIHIWPLAEEDHVLEGVNCRCDPRYEIVQTQGIYFVIVIHFERQ